MSLVGSLLFPIPNWSGLIHVGVGLKLMPWNPELILSGPQRLPRTSYPQASASAGSFTSTDEVQVLTVGWVRIQESEQKLAASGGQGPEPPTSTLPEQSMGQAATGRPGISGRGNRLPVSGRSCRRPG